MPRRTRTKSDPSNVVPNGIDAEVEAPPPTEIGSGRSAPADAPATIAPPEATRPRPARAPDRSAASPPLPVPSGKLGSIHGLIAAVGGATIDELVAATGWQPHTIRAALSRLRRRGFPIVFTTDAEGRKAYRLDVREG